jgi:hypothetical protein
MNEMGYEPQRWTDFSNWATDANWFTESLEWLWMARSTIPPAVELTVGMQS